MNKTLRHLKKAASYHSKYREECEKIEKFIQPYIDWDEITVSYLVADGLSVIFTDSHTIIVERVLDEIARIGIVKEDIKNSIWIN